MSIGSLSKTEASEERAQRIMVILCFGAAISLFHLYQRGPYARTDLERFVAKRLDQEFGKQAKRLNSGDRENIEYLMQNTRLDPERVYALNPGEPTGSWARCSTASIQTARSPTRPRFMPGSGTSRFRSWPTS